MTDADPTRIGRVRHVLGAQVTVALDGDLAGVAPIYRGRLQTVGQIGSIVRIPQGPVDLIGQVSLLGIAEMSSSQPSAESLQVGERWLQIELLGEVARGTGRFRRGVGTYPGLDDPVHFSTSEDLMAVFPPEDSQRVRIGRLAAAEEVPLSLAVSPLVTRHAAVVGSTGAGKTSCVSTILQGFATGGWDAANIIVIDPHGEYPTALEGYASIRSVLGTGGHGLRVPYWALTSDDILTAISGSTVGPTTRSNFAGFVTTARREFVASASWLTLDPASVTADTPVPFDIRRVWHQLDYENNETRQVKTDPTTVAETDAGDPATLTPARFEPYGAGGAAPHKGPIHGVHGPTAELLRLGLLDPRLAFLQQPQGQPEGSDPLVEELADWLGREQPISILDFSGVPTPELLT